MKPVKARFLLSAFGESDFPKEPRPEVAFAGRSNVGKSTLINGLLGVKNLARTSSTPGRTRSINFFEIDGSMRWADLPGYGYAAVSKKMSESWRALVEGYLLNRQWLAMTFVLVDPRHGPTESDDQLFAWFKVHDKPFAVVLTKTDKVRRSKLEEARGHCLKAGISGERIFTYSKKRPRDSRLWNFIKTVTEGF